MGRGKASRRIRSVSVAGGIGVLLMLSPGAGLGATASWFQVASQSPSKDNNTLYDVAAITSSDVWAVGDLNTGVIPTVTGRRTLVERDTGSGFRVVPSPNPSWSGLDLATLQGVAAISSTDIWAVGHADDFASLKSTTLVEHWDGSAWTIVPSPNPSGSSLPNMLFSVTAVATDDVWAVGQTDFPEKSLIEHFDGSAWTALANGCQVPLKGVTAVSATDVWAVGMDVACHYDGSTWQLVATPDPERFGALDFQLQDVSASASNVVWSAGFAQYQNGEGITTGPVVESWNGQQWTASTALPMTPNGIEVVSANDVYAVGFNGFGVVIAHWNGTRWRSVPTPFVGAVPILQDIEQTGLGEGSQSAPLWAIGSKVGLSKESALVLQGP